jgi:hypothetical protein
MKEENIIHFRLNFGQECFFPVHITTNETENGEFGAELGNAFSPCIMR